MKISLKKKMLKLNSKIVFGIYDDWDLIFWCFYCSILILLFTTFFFKNLQSFFSNWKIYKPWSILVWNLDVMELMIDLQLKSTIFFFLWTLLFFPLFFFSFCLLKWLISKEDSRKLQIFNQCIKLQWIVVQFFQFNWIKLKNF